MIHRYKGFCLWILAVQTIDNPIQSVMLKSSHLLSRLKILTKHQIIYKISYIINLKMKKNKDFKSIQQTLSFLSFIHKNQEAFSSKKFEYKPSQKQQNITPLQRFLSFDQQPKKEQQKNLQKISNKKKLRQVSEENHQEEKNKRLANRNRAIKRMIITSKQLLDKNYQYIEPVDLNDSESYMTQYKIYMKQYNRLNAQIHHKYKQKQQLKQRVREQEEKNLQKVYQYTVLQDFRQIIQTNILKQRISRENIDMMMEYFQKKLVTIKKNQLRIYSGENQDCQYKSFKLVEIGNVDYHTQPFFFTILTLANKSKNQQYIYFKFKSLNNQNKLDRALYCNYITRKITKKQKYFQLQYPEVIDEKQDDNNQRKDVEEQQKDIKKSYDVNRRKIVYDIVDQGLTRYATEGTDIQKQLMAITNRENTLQRKGTQPLSTPKESEFKPISSRNYEGDIRESTTKKVNNNNVSQKDLQDRSQQEKILSPSPNRSRKMSFSKLFPDWTANQSKVGQISQSKQNINQNCYSERSNSLPFVGQKIPETESHLENSAYQLNNNQQEQLSKQSSVSFILNKDAHRKAQLKQKYKEGIILTKSKFFGDKQKIFFLNNEGYQYWDYDTKTKHKDQRKVISFEQIKLLTVKSKQITIDFILKKKQMTFMGPDMNTLQQLTQWNYLHKKEPNQKIIETPHKKQGSQK